MKQAPLEIARKDMGNFEIIKGDTFKKVHELKDNSIQLLITSPPYNIGKEYEKRVDFEKYLEPYREFAVTVFDKIKEGGSVAWEVGNFVKKGEVFPLDTYFYKIFKDAGFKLRNRVIWHFGHGLNAKLRMSGRYETILWFTKNTSTKNYVFNLDPIRVPAKYPGKLAYKGKNRGKPSGNPLGKNPSDFWEIVLQDWEKLIWEIPNVKSNHPEKTSHPCQFPIELVQRCVLALSNEDDLVYDPFMGVGSTMIGAIMHGRNAVGMELDEGYISTTKQRIKEYKNGVLKIRPLGKPVYKPTGKEKVSKIPNSWL
ncbi:site-specific DNA-methyltransferase [bacterium]|nr:site-specific DNA-methyltransferase [bacterium]